MKNIIKAERYRFTHSGVLWTIIAALFFFALIAILTGSYNSAEAALRSVFRDIAVILLGSSVYGTIILSEDYSNGLLYHYIAAGYKRASVICAKFVYYVLGCCILLFIYPLLSVTFTAVIRGIETSYLSLSLDFIVLFVKSLPLYLGIMGLFFLTTILFQKAAIAMAISVALSLFFTGFPSIFRNVSFLKFTPMIQLSSITASSISVEYLITAILSLCFLGLCLGGSVLKINRDQF